MSAAPFTSLFSSSSPALATRSFSTLQRAAKASDQKPIEIVKISQEIENCINQAPQWGVGLGLQGAEIHVFPNEALGGKGGGVVEASKEIRS